MNVARILGGDCGAASVDAAETTLDMVEVQGSAEWNAQGGAAAKDGEDSGDDDGDDDGETLIGLPSDLFNISCSFAASSNQIRRIQKKICASTSQQTFMHIEC